MSPVISVIFTAAQNWSCSAADVDATLKVFCVFFGWVGGFWVGGWGYNNKRCSCYATWSSELIMLRCWCLLSVEVRLQSGAPCWGPALPTAIWSSLLRSGAAHCNLELPVEVWRCPLQSGAPCWSLAKMTAKRKERRRKEKGRRTAHIKSNNPHLTGGEKSSFQNSWWLEKQTIQHKILIWPQRNADSVDTNVPEMTRR